MKRILALISFTLFLITVCILAPVIGICQDTAHAAADTTVKATSGGFDILAWIKSNWYIVLPALYEFIVRVIPTANDWSWLNLLKKLLDFLIPNFSSKPTTKTH